MNLLLWGCETWLLRQTLLNKLEVFMHRSIRRILDITMTQVKDNRIWNNKVRYIFYDIPTVKNVITARQLDFIGKLIQGPPDQLARNMLTACCNNQRQVGHPQTHNKNNMVRNLQLLFAQIPTTHINRHGSLKDWINEASNEAYWTQLVKCLLHSVAPLPEWPAEWKPMPRRSTRTRPPPPPQPQSTSPLRASNHRNHQEPPVTPPQHKPPPQ